MSRPMRIEYPGAFYHATARGSAGESVFLDAGDRISFLDILADTIGRFGWCCHAYCLMDNHYHLLIETPRGNLARGMRQLNGVYTQSFNRRHGRTGPVFQGRYKAILLERDSYLKELCRYVVLNPLRVRKVREISHYIWSSYLATAGLAPVPSWLSVDWLLGRFGKNRSSTQRKYAEFVTEGKLLPSPWSELKGQILLGSESFVAQLQPRLKVALPVRKISRTQRPNLKTLLPKTVRADKLLRDDVIRQAYLEHGYTMSDIADKAGIHLSTVSKIIKGER